ncbi:unnamed protein product [Allacma fusca]|uniref:Secreted protein n=1 Tax=Allacma fusca TaxID=39272 RepID=A0A8J2KPI3_9HEXA|nr:unnamed protein product [Allacma fusca]
MRFALILCVLLAVQFVYCIKCNKTKPGKPVGASTTAATTLADEVQEDVVPYKAQPPKGSQGRPGPPAPRQPNNNGTRPCKKSTPAAASTEASATTVPADVEQDVVANQMERRKHHHKHRGGCNKTTTSTTAATSTVNAPG